MSEILQSEETVRLYEYELYKPELDENVLAHHGILGMHWGKRNGPPYPLSRAISTGKALKKKAKRKAAVRKAKKTRAMKKKQFKEQEKQNRSKEDIIKARDIESMLKNVGSFSDQEIRSVLNRIDVEEQLQRKVMERRKASRSRGRKIYEGAKEAIGGGVVRGAKSLASDLSANAVRIAAKKAADAIAEGDDELKKTVDELFKEKKKK